MSGWNHRVFKKFHKFPSDVEGMEGEWTFDIRETYYNDDGEITMHSNEPRPAFGDDLKGLKWTLQKMLEACDKEILEEDKIVYAKTDWDKDDERRKAFEIDDKLVEIQDKFDGVELELESEDSIVATYDSEDVFDELKSNIEDEVAETIGTEFTLGHKIKE